MDQSAGDSPLGGGRGVGPRVLLLLLLLAASSAILATSSAILATSSAILATSSAILATSSVHGQPSGGEPAEGTAAAELPKRFAEWLSEVDPILTESERSLFLALRKDYQRDAFIRQFWQVRDPYPETGRNEYRERWDERIEYARSNFGVLSDDRARILVVHGDPDRVVEVRCSTTRKPAEIWLYLGSEQVQFRFYVVFLRKAGLGPARIWHPRLGALDGVIRVASGCINGYLLRDVARAIDRGSIDYDAVLSRVLAKPRPRSVEWVASFASYSTDVPEGAERFPAETRVDYLGRHQQRTVVQGLVSVPRAAAAVGDYGGFRSYNFVLTGEVVLGDQLFETFRYKFGFPVVEDGLRASTIPMAFQRYLRPGTYTQILKLEDLNSGKFFRHERLLEVPKLEQNFELPPPTDAETALLFSEATEAVASGETTIRVVPPARDLQTGFVRIDTLVTGDEIDKVAFYVDDKRIVQKNRPPYNVELDLGPFPKLHRLRAEALGEDDQVLVADEVLLNAGGHRFSVNLIEPRKGVSYSSSLRARADVQVPDERTLQRMEFYVNENLVATLYQPPWVQPVVLPSAETVAYVRAVAYLGDGNSTEDLVFINAPNLLEEVSVQFVELYASVYDRHGRPIEGLRREDFSVEEAGVRQTIARFERVQDLPIHVGVLIDNSASMQGALRTTRRAALDFFSQAIQAKDRAAVITFNRFPHIAVKLTNDVSRLGGGLAGLTAEGQTALYDSVMFALYYFTGVTGQRAILLLSDGKDEVSRFSFEETLEYARRAGVTIYTIGLEIDDGGARRRLVELADETGGVSYFLHGVEELPQIYSTIERELRSQYMIAYQSSNTSREDVFRRIDLEVTRPGAVVKTMSGYYP